MDDGVVESPICGALRALRCSMLTTHVIVGCSLIRSLLVGARQTWFYDVTSTSAPARLTNHPHLGLPLHAIVRLHAAALSYPAESADASLEYYNWLVRSACAAYGFNVFDGAFFAVSFRWLTLFSAISSIYKRCICLINETESYRSNVCDAVVC
jgi:hypothetical protein